MKYLLLIFGVCLVLGGIAIQGTFAIPLTHVQDVIETDRESPARKYNTSLRFY